MAEAQTALCEELKKERSDAKRAVTLTSTRLTRAVEQNRAAAVHVLHDAIEEKYCAFLTVAEEYREACEALADEAARATFSTVGGKDLDAYEAAVEEVFANATETYRRAYPPDETEASATTAATTPATTAATAAAAAVPATQPTPQRRTSA